MNSRGTTTATPIVAPDHFLLATRDAGYRNLVSALTELIDNSLQAGATGISVVIQELDGTLTPDRNASVAVGVLDNGCGMSVSTLTHALQFGGSSRFDDRSGLGRFGMGLPNSAVSHARRLDVYSWQRPGDVYHSYLDVDEVVAGTLQALPHPRRGLLPKWLQIASAKSGTLVLWTRCDRITRLPTRAALEDMRRSLGRVYRYAIWKGARIQLNNTLIEPIDPLYLERRSIMHGARRYGRALVLEVAGEDGHGQIEVTFSELPVSRWHTWSVDEKRRFGIVGGSGVSIVRAEREIAYGWHFFGAKRREHYDDWWRCEIRFSPVLDRMFGVTFNKQGIRPSPELKQLLSNELEAVARTLNRRARLAFSNSPAEQARSATVAASRHDALLMPPASLATRTTIADGLRYRLEHKPISGREFYSVRCARGSIVVTLNTNHPFFTDPVRTVGGWESLHHRPSCLVDDGAGAAREQSKRLDRLSETGDSLFTGLLGEVFMSQKKASGDIPFIGPPGYGSLQLIHTVGLPVCLSLRPSPVVSTKNAEDLPRQRAKNVATPSQRERVAWSPGPCPGTRDFHEEENVADRLATRRDLRNAAERLKFPLHVRGNDDRCELSATSRDVETTSRRNVVKGSTVDDLFCRRRLKSEAHNLQRFRGAAIVDDPSRVSMPCSSNDPSQRREVPLARNLEGAEFFPVEPNQACLGRVVYTCPVGASDMRIEMVPPTSWRDGQADRVDLPG